MKKYTIRNVLRVIGDIFSPLLPGIISAGLCGAAAALIAQTVPNYAEHNLWAFLQQILTLTVDPENQYVLGGYSLGGLFALWAAYQSDAFSGVAAVSPSVWFPGFADYTLSHTLRTGLVYLSLGDREEKTGNPVMAAVGDRIREYHAHLQAQGVPCCLEWNEGNHFRNPDQRTAKGFAWILKRLKADS